jgi:Zn-dependent protease/predicted transcriptional regulator
MSLVFHETAHSLVARHYGMPMRGITLFIFGGVAEMTTEPGRPRDELLMAAAGPASSLLLAGILFLLFNAISAWDGPVSVATTFWYLAFINLTLAVFNLVPAFPLDGGRILRAALWSWHGDLARATRIAAGAGNAFGMLLIVLGLIGVLQGDFIGGMWRFLIGMFLRGAAAASYGEVLARQVLSDVPVTQVMSPDPITVPSALSAQDFINAYVYQYHHRWFPVVDDGLVVGSVDTRRVAELDRAFWPTVPLSRIMRPLSPDDAVAPEISAFAALAQMRRTGQSRLMVVRDQQLLGIVSSRDLLDVLSIEQEFDRRGFRTSGKPALQ